MRYRFLYICIRHINGKVPDGIALAYPIQTPLLDELSA